MKKYYQKEKREQKMQQKDKFIDMGGIYLRSLRQDDLAGNWYTWLNDPVVTRYQDKGIIPNTREKQQSYFEHLAKSSSDVVFAIVFDQTDRHIGNIGLHRIDFIHRHADVGIILGEKDYWNKGYRFPKYPGHCQVCYRHVKPSQAHRLCHERECRVPEGVYQGRVCRGRVHEGVLL